MVLPGRENSGEDEFTNQSSFVLSPWPKQHLASMTPLDHKYCLPRDSHEDGSPSSAERQSCTPPSPLGRPSGAAAVRTTPWAPHSKLIFKKGLKQGPGLQSQHGLERLFIVNSCSPHDYLLPRQGINSFRAQNEPCRYFVISPAWKKRTKMKIHTETVLKHRGLTKGRVRSQVREGGGLWTEMSPFIWKDTGKETLVSL